jgi:hypothetical protein
VSADLEKTATLWRCDEHQQGTNTIDHEPSEREVCWGSEEDPIDIPCRWVRAEDGSGTEQS